MYTAIIREVKMEVQVVINDALQSRRMSIKGKRFLLLSAGLTLFGNTLLAQSGGEKKSFQAFLDGFQEVPPVLTTAEGRFQGKVNDIESEIAYELEYSGMVSHVRAAHIHFGQPGVNGGIMVFLCDNTGAEPGAPACPEASGTVMGVLTQADVKAIAAQGIGANDFAAFLKALRSGAAYVNVHTDDFPNGEIRGQIGGQGRAVSAGPPGGDGPPGLSETEQGPQEKVKVCHHNIGAEEGPEWFVLEVPVSSSRSRLKHGDCEVSADSALKAGDACVCQ